MRILLVNIDAPVFNLAIRRLYNYFYKDHVVDMNTIGFMQVTSLT